MSGEDDNLVRIQNMALQHAVNFTLGVLAEMYGDQAKPHLEFIRNRLIRQFEDAPVPPEYDHATITTTAIAAITAAFDSVLGTLPNTDPAPAKPAPRLRLVT